MTDTVTLKPCPFCGGVAKFVDDPGVCDVPFGLVVHHSGDCFFDMSLCTDAKQIERWNTRASSTASSVGADVVEDCTACERLGVDCGEHVPSWEQLAIYWRTRALQAPSRAVPAEPSDEEVERAIDDGLVTRFRSALRFAASHSVISSADEHALLASLSTAQVDETERLRKAAQALLDGLTSTYTARNGREVGIQGDDGEKCYIVHSDLVFDLRAALSLAKGGE